MPVESEGEKLIRQFWEHHHLQQLKRFKSKLAMAGITCNWLDTEIAEMEGLL
mgnify:CR=1 FL=1